MTFARIYLRNRKVILPTVVLTEDGFYMDVEPVYIVGVWEDDLREVLLEALQKENQKVETPPQSEEPGSVVLDAVGIKRWEAFEKGAVMYIVHGDTDRTTAYVTGRGSDGMWQRDQGKEQVFQPAKPQEIVQWLLDDMAMQPEHTRPEPSLPMLLPPAKETNIT
jgi:hypothetical protein